MHIQLSSSEIEVKRDTITVFFTLINTGIPHQQALYMLKNLIHSFQFSSQV